MGVVQVTIRAARLDDADASAALFCASQKTLAAGVPMAQLIFGAHPGLGLILLPVMLYHPLQLMVHGMMAMRWQRPL
jgi:sodium/bile acid cotransporter 7